MSYEGQRREEKPKDPPPIDGVPPPHDLAVEAGVLSACMLASSTSDAFDQVSDFLNHAQFYSEAHRQIFEVIEDLAREGKPTDVLQVQARLKDTHRLAQVGGAGYLTDILDGAPHIPNVRAYARKVHDHWKLRQAILACQTFAARGYVERVNTGAFLAELEAAVSKVAGDPAEDRSVDARTLLKRVYERIKKSYSDGRPPGIATGFGSFDDKTVGLHRKEVTLVAARPGMGKTSFMLAMMINVAATEPLLLSDDGQPWQPHGCAFFSLEMPSDQIGSRMIAVESKVSAHRMRTGRVTDDDWSPMTQACQFLASLPIEIDDTAALGMGALRAKVRRVKAKFAKAGIRLAAVFVDYLQLMKGDGKANRRLEEIGEISRGLKQLSKDEDVAVVAGCQLNRALESRTGTDKRPRIADLRESGDLEQDADNVVFIHRPNYYGEKDPEGEEGRTELIIAKQRNGPTGTAIVRYVAGCTRFEEMPGYT